MKIKKGFVLCPVMGKTMVIASPELDGAFDGMIKMNGPSTKIWNWIEGGKALEEIYALYAEVYGIDEAVAKSEVDGVVDKMSKAGIFE